MVALRRSSLGRSTFGGTTMGWRGTVRSFTALARQMEREAKRAARAQEKHQLYLQRVAEVEDATERVARYEDHIERITSVHTRRTSDEIDWRAILEAPEPVAPQRSNASEEAARKNLDTYSPAFLTRLLGRTQVRRRDLEDQIELGRRTDDVEYQRGLDTWRTEHAEWTASRSLAEGVIRGDRSAMMAVIEKLGPFSEIAGLGSRVEFGFDDDVLVAQVHVHGEDIVPKHQQTQLKSGRLSSRQLPKGRFYEIYQDYVCGAVLEIATASFYGRFRLTQGALDQIIGRMVRER